MRPKPTTHAAFQFFADGLLLTSTQLANVADITRQQARDACKQMLVRGVIRRYGDDHPPVYQATGKEMAPAAPGHAPPLTTVQFAMKHVPRFVFDLGGARQ